MPVSVPMVCMRHSEPHPCLRKGELGMCMQLVPGHFNTHTAGPRYEAECTPFRDHHGHIKPAHTHFLSLPCSSLSMATMVSLEATSRCCNSSLSFLVAISNPLCSSSCSCTLTSSSPSFECFLFSDTRRRIVSRLACVSKSAVFTVLSNLVHFNCISSLSSVMTRICQRMIEHGK